MATVLIVEDDGLVARQLASAVRSDGHAPVLAADAGAAVREAALRPDLILLDLGLPDLPGEELLERLQRMPETARIPVVVVTGKTENAARLQERKPAGLADILLKPVNGARLTAAMRTALATSPAAPALSVLTPHEVLQRDLIMRLITQGPDRLAGHVYRRLCADRSPKNQAGAPKPLEWPDIAQWALLEGLVTQEEARLICRSSAGPGHEGTPPPP